MLPTGAAAVSLLGPHHADRHLRDAAPAPASAPDRHEEPETRSAGQGQPRCPPAWPQSARVTDPTGERWAIPGRALCGIKIDREMVNLLVLLPMLGFCSRSSENRDQSGVLWSHDTTHNSWCEPNRPDAPLSIAATERALSHLRTMTISKGRRKYV